MNASRFLMLVVTMLVALSATTAPAAPIAIGDMIGVDLGDPRGTTPNWVNITTDNPVGPLNVVNANTGTPIDNVQVTFGGASGGENSLGDQLTNTTIPLTAVHDGVWAEHPVGGLIDVTFTNLDTSLLYSVNMYALVRGQGGRTVDFLASGASDWEVLNQDRQVMYAAYENFGTPGATFQNISSDGSGSLKLTFRRIGDSFTANALTLEATSTLVPEPSSIQLFGLMALLAGCTLWGWRRRRSQA